MANYFIGVSAKPAIKGSEKFNTDGSRPDLIQEHQQLVRRNILTREKVAEIDGMFRKWVDLLFSNFNIVVLGPQSKFSLLETFKARYLDSHTLPNWKETSKRAKNITYFKINTVRLHGLDPIKIETFNHAMFGSTSSSKKQLHKEIDYFVDETRKKNKHFVFLIHSFDYFIRDCEDVCETIYELHKILPKQIHLLISSDVINASKKLTGLKFKFNLLFFQAPFTESFSYERSQLVNEFDVGAAADQPLFSDQVDLRSLKDVYQALGNTGTIMLFILKDFVEKCDQDEKKSTNDLDFQFLLRYCENKFIIRRAAGLRAHLGELEDHNIISFDGTRIKCLVNVRTCKDFIDYAES